MMTLTIPPFRRRDDDSSQPSVTRLGAGSAGGKAQGLALLEQEILPRVDRQGLEEISLEVPRAVALGTNIYDAFLEHNGLTELAEQTDAERSGDRADERVRQAFARAELPPLAVGDLRALLSFFDEPLAIRSSSLLEDALDHPFAGVYGTKMIPNKALSPDKRFKQLLAAIKFVYATTLFRGARTYLRSLPGELPAEKMALVLQRIVGRRFGSRFYPCVSIVARSFNYYAVGHATPEDGVVDLALGLGKTIVDGGQCWSYCPAYPTAPPPATVQTLLDSGQRQFWALDLEPPPRPEAHLALGAAGGGMLRESEFLVQEKLEVAEAAGILPPMVSCYDGASDRLLPGLRPKGARLLNFAPLLLFDEPPLNEALKRLMAAAEETLGAAVELELAAHWDPAEPRDMTLSVLQVRAMRVSAAEIDLDEAELDSEDVIVASESALGNGELNHLEHIVYLKPEVFDAAKTRDMAREVSEFNELLGQRDAPYALIGFGRWGSSDSWLGVPVTWSDISGAKLIVEATLPEMNTELSQGSHFFHNMISFGVYYLSLRHGLDRPIDYDYLESLETVAESAHVRVVRSPRPLTARVDGRHGRGLLRR